VRRGEALGQFLRFCVVGTIGFVIDAGVLQALVSGAGVNPYAARVGSFLVAVTATWWLNRHYTFAVTRRPTHAEWVRYVSFMVVGATANYAAFAIAITVWDLARANLWIGVAIGSLTGMGINFTTSRTLIFTERAERAG
jgi:putative flippase GtrA